MSKIALNNDYDDTLSKIIATMCIKIQNTYDIYPEYINEIINNIEFTSSALFLQKQYFEELQCTLKYYRNFLNDNENCKNNPKDAHIDLSITPLDLFLCGHKILLPNNTITYCNKHKYLHNDSDKSITHEFLQKTNNTILTEKYNALVTKIYEQYINKMIDNLYGVFMHTVLKTHKVISCEINSIEMQKFINLMKNDKTLFKCKFASINDMIKCYITA